MGFKVITKKYKLERINKYYSVHNINSIVGVERLAEKHGSHFFSPDTMRFFKSKTLYDVFPSKNGVYFVTSEKKGFSDNTRVFNVRFIDINTGSISTIGGFGAYETRAQALTGALNCAFDSLESDEV